jgi:hypothetical protein
VRVDTRPRKRNSPRIAEKSAPAFLQWLRGRECACHRTSIWCEGKILAAHVDHGGDKGMGTKASDRFAIPLSDGCHRRQHAHGWRSFEITYLGGDAVKLAEAYWRAWPGRIAWERKLADNG